MLRNKQKSSSSVFFSSENESVVVTELVSGENWAKIFAAFNKLLLSPNSHIFEKYWFLL